MDFLNLYGFDKLPYLLQLEENKLIKVQSSDKSKFKDHLIKTMKLTEKNRDIFNPANSSYVFDSLWNPITTKLVHEAVSGKFLFFFTRYKWFQQGAGDVYPSY